MVKSEYPLETSVIHIIPENLARIYKVVPIRKEDEKLVVYCDSDLTETLKTELESLLNISLIRQSIETKELQEMLNSSYCGINSNLNLKISNINEFPEELIEEALKLNCSDIHIEPMEKYVRVRLRVDGKLLERKHYSTSHHAAMINKIKVQANLDISEKRLPQDGRIQFETGNVNLDLRVSCIPSTNGEKLVIRLLQKDSSFLRLDNLGLTQLQLSIFRENLRHQNGIILISGPTGSGKTSTLYACLHHLNNSETNILTVEDPVEYRFNGITQVQTKESIGLDFSKVLRSFLRQDPDIIMLGEIRDSETAKIATRAALTGHLILSTIHTNSAWDSVSRLMDLGVAPYLIAGTLRMSIAQRLIRILCNDCKVKDTNVLMPLHFENFNSPEFFRAQGCSNCFYTGYRGRKALYEIIVIDKELRQKIRNNEHGYESILKKEDFISLKDQALNLFKHGECGLEDVMPYLN